MKLEKLRLLKIELNDEFSTDGNRGTVYYYFDNKWSLLDSDTPISANTIRRLDRSLKEPIAYCPKGGVTAWYTCKDPNCAISLTSPINFNSTTLLACKQRIEKAVKRGLNAFKVSHNPLTQLYSREAFREKLSNALGVISLYPTSTDEAEGSAQDKVLAIFALDIDHFKQINDTYGHLYADQVLKIFALRLESASQEIMRNASIPVEINLGHPSGEEFLISVTGCPTRDQLLAWANLFRTKICDEILPSETEWGALNDRENLSAITPPLLQERVVRTSCGIAIRVASVENASKSESIDAILDEADTALLKAKASGRNQVIAFDEILSSYGRVLEQDAATRIIAIDIGLNVGVSIGQEFKVYAPGYTGKKKYTINDGRTVRSIGNYPRVELTRITVFNTQPELSFAYITDTTDQTTVIEPNSHLEAIPSGSISLLLSDASKYFPTTSDHIKIGDSSAVQDFIKTQAKKDTKPYAIVFRLDLAQEYLKKHGSAALNTNLARLYRDITSTFPQVSAISIIDGTSICIVGQNSSLNLQKLSEFVEGFGSELSELRLLAGIFCHKDVENPPTADHSVLIPTNAIEFARFAASEYAMDSSNRIVHFGFETANRILKSLFDSLAYKQGLADFEKLRSLGVESAVLLNRAGLFAAKLNKIQQSADLYEAAMKRDPKSVVYKSNLAIALNSLSNYARALELYSSLSDKEIVVLKTTYPYGLVTYAVLLAKAKLARLPTFNPLRFAMIASDALNSPILKGSESSKVIAEALIEP